MSKKVSRERFLREQFGTAERRISFRHEWNVGDPRRHQLRYRKALAGKQP